MPELVHGLRGQRTKNSLKKRSYIYTLMINQCLRTCNVNQCLKKLQNLNTAGGKTEEEVHLETEEEGMAGTRVGEVLPVRKEGDP